MTKKLTPSATTEIVSVTVTVLAMWAAVEWLKRKTENPKAKETLRPGQIPEQKQAGDGTVTANEEGKPANGVAEVLKTAILRRHDTDCGPIISGQQSALEHALQFFAATISIFLPHRSGQQLYEISDRIHR
jgi:hypothetical protein